MNYEKEICKKHGTDYVDGHPECEWAKEQNIKTEKILEEEQESYNKQIGYEKIINYIESNSTDQKYYFYPETGKLQIIFDNYMITLFEGDTLENIKEHIDNKLNEIYKNEKCSVCKKDITKNVSCNKCFLNYCIYCYIEIFKKGKGVITCPKCNYKIGSKRPSYLVNKRIQEIKLKIGLI
uniref:RING-type domain-containing protein n=1 Tax=Pithovirus LCDPAC02 TaxID=2506601 RepID=A0A481YPN7_9VIRU|nr:MAG: hypothetical protein LCDPAC02_02580 [Pithovirus LCDPAC02]